jgi:hypothetical protein
VNFLLVVCCTVGIDLEVANDIAQYRRDLEAIGMHMETNLLRTSAACMRLDARGPNSLPEMAEALADESDPRVLRFYNHLFFRCSRAWPYRYSSTHYRSYGLDIVDTEPAKHPWFSLHVGPDGLGDWEAILPMRDLYVRWWREHESFPKPDALKAVFRGITGKTDEEFSKYDESRARLLWRDVEIFGIMAYPSYVDLVAEDNNPISFLDLLVSWPQSEINCIGHGKTRLEDAKNATATFPTRESKAKVICHWWDDNKSAFTRLTDLYSEIDTRVTKMRKDFLKDAPLADSKPKATEKR